MKALFQKWLLLFVLLAFGLTFGLSWYLHRKEAKKNALQLLELNLKDASERVKQAEVNLQTITEMSAASAIAKTRAFALLIKEKPSILTDPEELRLIRKKLDVDELHVSDKSGKLIASLANSQYHSKNDYVGYDLSKSEQSRVFMKAITDPSFELVQEPQFNGAERKLFQYAGVARLDAPGVVQIGYLPERIKKAQQLADVKKIENEMRIGMNGKLSIRENSLYPPDYKKVFYTREGLCQSAVYGKYLLTALLPWQEVYKKDRTVITALFVGNIVVFALIFFLTAGLLNKVVIKEISDVTNSLDEFLKGNSDKKIDVKGSAEMHDLAENINKTLSVLKNNAVPARVENSAEIMAVLKNSLVPAEIPQGENFRFTAEIMTAEEVGGNLCDIFKMDNDHIAIFFVDVAEKNVSGGLYMMSVKNMLRKALSKNSPAKALRIVNEELFYDGQKNMAPKAFLCVLNLRSGVLLTFNAGHVDPVIKSGNGNVKFIKGPLIPALGSSLESAFTALPFQLNPGDELWFYSNGTVDVQNSGGENYGSERLLKMIASSGAASGTVIKSLCQEISAFTGKSAPESDIAVAVLEYMPSDKSSGN